MVRLPNFNGSRAGPVRAPGERNFAAFSRIDAGFERKPASEFLWIGKHAPDRLGRSVQHNFFFNSSRDEFGLGVHFAFSLNDQVCGLVAADAAGKSPAKRATALSRSGLRRAAASRSSFQVMQRRPTTRCGPM